MPPMTVARLLAGGGTDERGSSNTRKNNRAEWVNNAVRNGPVTALGAAPGNLFASPGRTDDSRLWKKIR